MHAIRLSYLVTTFMALAGCLLSLALPIQGSAGELAESQRNTIVVQGKGSINVVPDELQFVIGIDARAPTADRAYAQVEDKMKEVMRELQRLDIPAKDIQAMSLSLQPVIDYKKQQQIIGHDARRDIAIKLRDIDRYGVVMQALGEIDITRFQNVQLLSSRQQALAVEALEKAYLDAAAKAERLTKVSGTQLKGLVHLQEHGSRPPQMMTARMSMEFDSAAATTSKGTIGIEASITATFAIE